MPISEEIRRVMENDPTLISLDLTLKRICDAGAQAMETALTSNSTLQSLYLAGNKINDVGGEAIAKALEINTTLINLHIFLSSPIHSNSIQNCLKRNRILQIQIATPAENINENNQSITIIHESARRGDNSGNYTQIQSSLNQIQSSPTQTQPSSAITNSRTDYSFRSLLAKCFGGNVDRS